MDNGFIPDNVPIVDELLGTSHERRPTHLLIHRKLHVGDPRTLNHVESVAEVDRERLLTEKMLASDCRANRNRRLRLGRHRNIDNIDGRIVEKLREVAVDPLDPEVACRASCSVEPKVGDANDIQPCLPIRGEMGRVHDCSGADDRDAEVLVARQSRLDLELSSRDSVQPGRSASTPRWQRRRFPSSRQDTCQARGSRA